MSYQERAKQIFSEEITELQHLADSINDSFDAVVDAILACKGRLVMMGIGKTGIIARKMASSLASTGTPSFFINAAEAVHGDLGMISSSDIVMLVSNSGSTNEILNVIAPLRKIGCQLIALTGDVQSPLAKDCDLVLSVHVDREACPLGLAPTTSTTATLLMGDALLVCLMEKRRFKAENFSLYHPGGALGRQLLGKVKNRMSSSVPRVQACASFKEVVAEVTEKHFGTTFVYDGDTPCGIITDGDIRRAIQKYDDLHAICARDVMSVGFKHIPADSLLTEALALLDQYNITTLAVTPEGSSNDGNLSIVGILSIHHIIDFVG